MKFSRLSLQVQKYIACALHLIFLILMLSGIVIMYLNDNFGTGLIQIGKVNYEDTDEFVEQFNSDLNDIFLYIEYEDVFARGGSIDVSKEMLRMTFGPNETESFSLTDLITYLQTMGYRLDEDFGCTKVAEKSVSGKSREGYVDWSASEPDRINTYLTPDMRRSTLEDASLEIMDTLHRYYTAYSRFFVNPSNLHFKIEYDNPESSEGEQLIYTNTDSLTPESVREYGKHAYLPGNSVFYDTNLRSISLSTISALSANNPYEGNSFFLLAGVDTTYPVEDLYAENHLAYVRMQHNYIIGFILMALGGLVGFLTLLFLLHASGHQSVGDRSITLHSFDRTSTETGIVLSVLTGILALLFSRFALVRIGHLIMPEETWYLADRCVYTFVLYLSALLMGFSLLRRYKAGTLWTGSFLFRWRQRMSLFFTRQSFTGRLVFSFLGYIIINTLLVSLAWFIWDRLYLNLMVIYAMTALTVIVCALFNLWVFYCLFRHSAEQDAIRRAVERLSAGETSYQLNLDDFDGQELSLAEGLNNISSGLDTALQEKVKSERLKTDLITNVSHDIKTPLTSIINYVDLIKREHIQNEKIAGYLEVLEQKSQRLKTLIEDLVEASKASSGNVKLEFCDIDIIQMIYQTNGEFEEKFSSRHLTLVTNAPDETLLIKADGRRLWRILENLYNNVYKYALEGSRVYVDIEKKAAPFAESGDGRGQVVFTIKNISANPLNFRGEDLTERFVRGDVARTTEGSGLGLSIAKDLTELQKGKFNLYIDGDLFKIQLIFNLIERNDGCENTPESE